MKKYLLILVASLFIITGCTNNKSFLEEYTLDKDSLPKNYLKAYNVKISEKNIKTEKYSYYIEKSGVKFPNIDNDFSLANDTLPSTSIYKNSKSDYLAFQLFNKEDIQSLFYQQIIEDENINNIKEKYPKLSLETILEKENLDIKDDIDVIYFIVKNYDLKVTDKSSKEDIIKRYYVDLLAPIYIPNTETLEFYTGDQFGYTIRQNNNVIIHLSKDENTTIGFIFQFKEEQDAINFLEEASKFVSGVITQ